MRYIILHVSTMILAACIASILCNIEVYNIVFCNIVVAVHNDIVYNMVVMYSRTQTKFRYENSYYRQSTLGFLHIYKNIYHK